VKVLVGASAALLVLGRDIALFDHVRRIVIKHEIAKNVGGHYQQMESRLGEEVVETWGVVELAWKHVTEGFVRAEGQNTALHEFAHAFDDADGKLDALMSHRHYERWRTLLHKLPIHHRFDGEFIHTEYIGDAEGPELFASATELFFERPHKLRDLDRELFDALVEIYAIDPRQLTTP
jgi:MtfA peptidase